MEARLLHNEISHLTALLSLIYPGQRFPEQEGIDDTPHLRGRDPTSFPQNVVEFGDDEGEHVDETEFECELTSIEAPASDALKQRALDRLAEVLARYKTNPKNVRAHTSGSNRDAKHVASVVLVEDSDPEYGYTTFVCSKNEGLDAVDMAFLAELKRYLERAATCKRDSILNEPLPS
ncbi:hypothetical protein DL546_008811 [Coniochaeta pulveracea]|uniref:Uncharacterized protein n=1 Tax=Coniochaeta pulveracea TaxID=177199 RepID=A0A420YLX2_9PEZI|nr:hypothetical protein DL546_008811 [Coniochaeta pulveracea]